MYLFLVILSSLAVVLAASAAIVALVRSVRESGSDKKRALTGFHGKS